MILHRIAGVVLSEKGVKPGYVVHVEMGKEQMVQRLNL